MNDADDTSLLRYVIQRHTWKGVDHFDFMFEVSGWERLRTFQMPDEPNALRVRHGVSLRETAPHRREYLDYEGPVSEERGEVAIWDSGRLRTLRHSSRMVEIELYSKRGREHPVWIFHFTGGSDWHLMASLPRPIEGK